MNKKNIGNNALETAGVMTSSEVMNILAKHGTIVTEDEIIFDFLSQRSKITVARYFRLGKKVF
ncbi:MAG: hypothetical protein JSR97_12210 [Verrucomicrobia bacterium]|nr:hypothetical protein [Verrucomicrobiota bacterium]